MTARPNARGARIGALTVKVPLPELARSELAAIVRGSSVNKVAIQARTSPSTIETAMSGGPLMPVSLERVQRYLLEHAHALAASPVIVCETPGCAARVDAEGSRALGPAAHQRVLRSSAEFLGWREESAGKWRCKACLTQRPKALRGSFRWP